jgi:hypothetical protein
MMKSMAMDITVKGLVRPFLLCGFLFFGPVVTVYSPDVSAAPPDPLPGVGPVCPPACPPNAVNCDANLVITATQDLQFGSMAAPLAGTVIVNTAGARIATGGVVLIGAGGAAASFSMSTGAYTCTNKPLVIVTAGPSATLTHATLPATMTVDTFTTSLVPGDNFTSPLTVGATLNVGTLQASGSYSGTFQVTVTFQ